MQLTRKRSVVKNLSEQAPAQEVVLHKEQGAGQGEVGQQEELQPAGEEQEDSEVDIKPSPTPTISPSHIHFPHPFPSHFPSFSQQRRKGSQTCLVWRLGRGGS